MSKIKVGFITPDVREEEPRHLELPAVPRVGDHVTLNNGKLFRVSHVHWSYTAPCMEGEQGFGKIEVHLDDKLVDAGFAKSLDIPRS